MTPAPAVEDSPGERERTFGLLLFEAEEYLARGQGQRAVVLASKAVKDRPDSVTARALYERARRELLRGRRREKLEAKIREAQALFDAQSFREAERIVTSALKLIPDHPVALVLLTRLKERRLSPGPAEAEAEHELDRLARLQAKQAFAAARRALAAGWDRRAMMAVRRGLRLVPGDPELLAQLKQLQQTGELSDQEVARRRALLAQVREATELLPQGRLEESLKILRAVLREDPDNARAQAAVQEVRRARLHRVETETPAPTTAPLPVSSPVPPAPVEPVGEPRPVAASESIGAPSEPSRPAPSATPAVLPSRSLPSMEGPRIPPLPTATPLREADEAIPPEILLPRARRKATPLGLVLCSAAIVLGLLFYLTSRTAPPQPTAGAPPRATLAPPPSPGPQLEEGPSGPLAGLAPDLHQVIEETLSLYARALESSDRELLARARPDLTGPEREALLAPFLGAVNVATDLRILRAVRDDDEVMVTVLRTDVIVGGRGGQQAPSEEVFHFVRSENQWALRRGEPGR